MQAIREVEFTLRQPRWVPITLYFKFSKRRSLANEGLVNFTADTASELRSSTPRASVLPTIGLLHASPMRRIRQAYCKKTTRLTGIRAQTNLDTKVDRQIYMQINKHADR